MHELVKARGFEQNHVVPVAALLRPMPGLHKNTKWACTLDCTHYCYHPEVWAALLDGVYRRLGNFFSAAAAAARVGARANGGAAARGTSDMARGRGRLQQGQAGRGKRRGVASRRGP